MFEFQKHTKINQGLAQQLEAFRDRLEQAIDFEIRPI